MNWMNETLHELVTYANIKAVQEHISINFSVVHPCILRAQILVTPFGETAPAEAGALLHSHFSELHVYTTTLIPISFQVQKFNSLQAQPLNFNSPFCWTYRQNQNRQNGSVDATCKRCGRPRRRLCRVTSN